MQALSNGDIKGLTLTLCLVHRRHGCLECCELTAEVVAHTDRFDEPTFLRLGHAGIRERGRVREREGYQYWQSIMVGFTFERQWKVLADEIHEILGGLMSTPPGTGLVDGTLE
jgi:hypothetical protein